jgi:Cd2+/Zn2+-exporting ATPase
MSPKAEPPGRAGHPGTRPDEAVTFVVSGVCCATEEVLLRRQINAAVGPLPCSYNPVTRELRVAGTVRREALIRGVRAAGFGIRERHARLPREPFLRRHGRALLTASAAVTALGGGILLERGALEAGRILLAVAMAAGGWQVFGKALRAVRRRTLDMNVLMTIAVAGAAAVGKWEEGAAVIVLFAVSLMLESYSTERTRRAVESLMRLSPEEAVVLRGGAEQTVPASEVREGETVFIRPGVRIPVDGIVLEGSSTVSEAMLTGEAAPVEKGPGTEVYAGCLNERGALSVTVSKRFEDTRLARIIQLIEEAQHQRAPVQTSLERFAGVYTWVVMGGAVLIAAVPPLLLGEPFTPWLYRALVMLVIACPCALVISTPVTIVSALTSAARSGILIKGGRHLETLAAVRAVAFDKTGTLTEGRLSVTDILPLNGISRDALLRLIAAIEHRSEHPLASAVLREAAASRIDYRPVLVEQFEALPGRGVRAVIDGEAYYLGNRILCVEHGFDSAALAASVRRLEDEGKLAVLLGREGEALGALALRDNARPESAGLVGRMRACGIEHLVMLSGDSDAAVDRLGSRLGLDDQTGEMLPADKVEAVQALRREFGVVAMVGDGINDTPALAASSVGIAMGAGGADAALESADVVLMADTLEALPPLILHSRKALRIIRQNIVFALALKGVFLLLSVAGISTLWMAVLADDGAALLVILNGLRALSPVWTHEKPLRGRPSPPFAAP